MKIWLRRLRGALGIGTLWAAAGVVVGKVAGLVVSLSFGSVGAAGIGFALGTAFAVVLTTFERRRSADQLTPARAAGWGAIAGAGLILVVGVTGDLPTLPVQRVLLLLASSAAAYGALAAGLAACTVALARRAPAELDAPTDHAALLPSSRGS